MERKISRRIVGSLIVVALVIILLPLFNSNDNQPLIQSATSNKPDFPVSTDSTIALGDNVASNIPETQTHKLIKNIIAKDSNLANIAEPVNVKQNVVVNTTQQQMPVESTGADPQNVTTVKVIPSIQDAKPEVQSVVAENNKSSDAKKYSSAVKNKIDLASLKNPAWVVQMGSFRNKNNAARLINSLRSKGYKAFTYETKSNNQVRVYVGPEFKRVAAASLANKITKDMQLQGVVLTYIPLEI